MKTIVIDCRMLRSSGIGTYLRAVLGGIIASKRYHLNLIGKEAEIIDWLPKDIEHVSVINCVAPIYGIREQWLLWRSIPQNTDLYWAPHYIIPLLYKGKLMVTVHDLNHLNQNTSLKGYIIRNYANFMFYQVKSKANAIIAVSEFTKGELIKHSKVNPHKITVIYSGCPIIVDGNGDNYSKKASYILFVGNVKPHKNLTRVIEAHAKVFSTIKKPLVIVGQKTGFITGDRAVAALISSIPDGQVIFTGYVSDQELAGYYRTASMLVFASLYEGFGFPPLEAMSYGIPVLASNAASIPEVCGDSVVYCDPYSVDDIANKIALLDSDQNLRDQLIRKGNERIKLFSWENCVTQHLRIIQREIL